MSDRPVPYDLPSVLHAKLPASYESAKAALAECTRIDECWEWANKAEAMASYAKQSKDQTLRQMADRIQARAIRRCGELLLQIRASQGERTDIELGGGALPKLTRTGAARDAGLSEHQYKTAVRVGRVPESEFEEAVESDDPPTVTALADRGRQSVSPQPDHLKGRDPRDFAAGIKLYGLLHHIVRSSPSIDIPAAIRGLDEREIADVLAALPAIHKWTMRISDELENQ
jgi:hypothetical protein